MLTDYLAAAMQLATYSLLEESSEWVGEIPGFQGVWAVAAGKDECVKDLRDALESWLLFRIAEQLPLPTAGGIRLVVPGAA